MNMEEIIELIKTGQNYLLEQKLNNNPLLADCKTEQGLSLLQFAAYCRNNFAVNILKNISKTLTLLKPQALETLKQLP